MIDLDNLATAYLDDLEIPPGPGVDAIRDQGRRRRTRLVTTSTALFAAALCVLGVGVFTVREGRSLSISAVDDGPESVGNQMVELVDIDGQLDVLAEWTVDEIPLVPTPSVQGWVTEAVAVTSPNRFEEDTGPLVSYRLRRGEEQLAVEVLPGQIELGGSGRESLVLERPDGAVSAALDNQGDRTSVLWNERPGVNSGTAVILSGPTADTVVRAAAQLVFDDVPLRGAESPDTMPLDADRSILVQGVTSGTEWQISRSGNEPPIIEIAGLALTATSEVRRPSTLRPGVAVTSVTFDRRQINMVRMPQDALAEVVDANRNRVPLPSIAVPGTTYSIALAPIPAGKNASVIVVRYADRTETTIGLPWIPASGWSTYLLNW